MRTYQAAGLTVDFSRTPLVDVLEQQQHSGRLASRSAALQQAREAMFSGAVVNVTEQRSAMHTALRDIETPSTDFARQATEIVGRISDTATAIREGYWKGASGQPIRSIINIGIGGSDFGPRLICDALADVDGKTPALRSHFVANIDPSELSDALQQCEPESTLVILASKTFGTLETLANGDAAIAWLLRSIDKKNLSQHLFAITADAAKARQYGVASDNILPFWDWVGGRYSLWSAIGLAIAITHGPDTFRKLLDGARAIDEHFRSQPIESNVPVLMALLEDHYVNQLNAHSIAVLPYSHRLRLLPAYLQQLCMESNGKSVRNNGEPVAARTCPVIWGSAGTVGQHSYYQLLHQGTEFIPADFILLLSQERSREDLRAWHLLANGLAQSKALYEGKSREQAKQELLDQGMSDADAESLAVHREVAGGKPNTLIGLPQLDAFSLGALIALYEHKVFSLSVFWEINAFDQWGVELGKQLSGPIFTALTNAGEDARQDAITQSWIERVKATGDKT